MSGAEDVSVERLVLFLGQIDSFYFVYPYPGIKADVPEVVPIDAAGDRAGSCKVVLDLDVIEIHSAVVDVEQSVCIVRDVGVCNPKKSFFQPCSIAGYGKRI